MPEGDTPDVRLSVKVRTRVLGTVEGVRLRPPVESPQEGVTGPRRLRDVHAGHGVPQGVVRPGPLRTAVTRRDAGDAADVPGVAVACPPTGPGRARAAGRDTAGGNGAHVTVQTLTASGPLGVRPPGGTGVRPLVTRGLSVGL